MIYRLTPMERFVGLLRRPLYWLGLIRMVREGGQHAAYTNYTVLKDRHPWLRFFAVKKPTTHAPWLNGQAVAYREAMGRTGPFLG